METSFIFKSFANIRLLDNCHYRQFCEVLKREQALTSITINQMLAEHPAPPKQKCYLDSTANIVQNFESHMYWTF